ncbi:DUF7283 family protein [Natrinema versiforme]|uniref:Uncharacterized protein n=1 Tax=Natrinema versiforme JCM 10478 TaxID=1227496 RepID=L9Y4C1_9EURY|nr:hypothetical protein [Natrinema versiforme]ELY67738.1 hypothetical protein C489_09266 [Natrinema versiforme JCM 10478]
MDLETPVDGWYVWLAVSIVSVAIAGIAVGLPNGPPPDANRAANAIEETAGSTADASSTYDHDATEIKFDGRTVAMRNEHGTARASLTYGHVVPVMGHERLENLSAGRAFAEEYATELDRADVNAFDVFLEDVDDAYADNTGEWRTADERLRTRTVSTTPVPTVSAAVAFESVPGDQTHEGRFAYEANTDATVQILATGSNDLGQLEKSVDAGPSKRTANLGPDDLSDHSVLYFPIDVRVRVGDEIVCTETISAEQSVDALEGVPADHDTEMVPVCGSGGAAIDTPAEIPGYVRHNAATERFDVTLVDV